MKLRYRKRLFNSLTVGFLLTSAGVVVNAFVAEEPAANNATASAQASSNTKRGDGQLLLLVVDPQLPSWQRQLRRPLYDPPPPPKVIVKKKPRPIAVKLIGTVLEAKNSQAFLEMPNGSMALKRLGDQVSEDPRDGTVVEITASEIVIQRDEDEVCLKVGG